MSTEPAGNAGPASTPAPAAAAPAADAGPSVAEILAFDPFAPPEKPAAADTNLGTDGKPLVPSAEPKNPTADGTVGKPGEKPGAAAAPAATPGAPDPAKPASPPTPQPNFEQLLREQTDLIRQAVTQPKPAPSSNEPTPPKFNLGIPPQILEGMRSEDPKEFATAFHATINGIANHIWDQVTKHLEGDFTNGLQQRFTQVRASEDTAKAVHTDFYGKYKTLDNELLRPMIQQAGVQVAQARMAAGKSVAWGEEMRDEIAETVFKVMPHLRPVAPAAPNNGQQPPAQRFVSGGGGPRAVDTQPNDNFGADLLQ